MGPDYGTILVLTRLNFESNLAEEGYAKYINSWSNSTTTVRGCLADYDEVQGASLDIKVSDTHSSITGDLCSFECTPK